MIPGFQDLSLYEILDVSPGGDAKEVQEGYYRVREAFAKNSLASYSLFSPEEREEILQLIEEAYRTLIDKEAREEYDRVLYETRSRLAKEVKVIQETLPFMESGELKAELEGEPEEAPAPAGQDEEYPDQAAPVEAHEEEGETTEPELVEAPQEKARAEEVPGPGIEDKKEVAAENMEPKQAPPSQPPEPKAAPGPEPEVSAAAREKPAGPEPEPAKEPESPETVRETPAQTAPPEEVREQREEPPPGGEAFEDTIPDIPPPKHTINPLDYLEGGVTGEFFKRVREAKGISYDQVWEVTRIRRPLVKAIEEEEYKKLPADVFLKGMLLVYSRLLEIENPESIVKGYMDRLIASRDWME